MEQWLYVAGVIVVLLGAWRYAVRPWLEKRAGPVDDRQPLNRAASREARHRRALNKDRPDGYPY